MRGLRLHPVRLARPLSTARPPPPVEPTTFSGKSVPRQVHERPEASRGIPPWTPSTKTFPRASVESEAFAGPSRPRLMYDRPEERDLPQLKVGGFTTELM